MSPTEKLIQDFARRGHPLGRVIAIEDVPLLIEALRRRLDVSSSELDVSPTSLKRLEQNLIDLHQAYRTQDHSINDEELIRLVREIAAYLGEVLARWADGKWGKDSQTLWSTEIVVEGPWEVTKERRYVSPYPTHFIVGGEAAWMWDAITEGKKPNIYRLYQQAKTKRLRESL